jgi:4-hydroxy-tetrahydrodipicolinate reductase
MSQIKVMVNGLPGNMATLMAKHVLLDDRLQLIPYSLTGPDISEKEFLLDHVTMALVQPEKKAETVREIAAREGVFISVDFTLPTAVSDNVEFYCANNLPFVMGTTGGDRSRLGETVRSSGISAIISPNMAKQIVGFQAMMESAATSFPDLFKGYSLEIKESHQQGKADTSGTAKAMVSYFNQMGVDFTEQQIQKVRDPQVQTTQMGVPEEFVSGHGWHTYALVSNDRTVRFEFTHNVNGRDVYAKGTIDGIIFLNKKLQENITGQVFTMIDVLRGV